MEPLEYNSLWANVIRSKLGHTSNNWDAAHTSLSTHCSPWKGLLQILHIFIPFTRMYLGCGNLIRFWLDP